MTSLTSLTFPDSLTSIGDYAFYGCSSLEFNEYAGVYYLGNTNNPYQFLIKVKDNSVTSVTIHKDTKYISGRAFIDCVSLTSIEIPDGVISIGSCAFYNCTSLTSVTIPESVTSIGSCAFCNCTSLTGIVIPGGVTFIGDAAFFNCTSLTSVTFENTRGWQVSAPAWNIEINIAGEELADPSTAATYLKSTYNSYYWKRS